VRDGACSEFGRIAESSGPVWLIHEYPCAILFKRWRNASGRHVARHRGRNVSCSRTRIPGTRIFVMINTVAINCGIALLLSTWRFLSVSISPDVSPECQANLTKAIMLPSEIDIALVIRVSIPLINRRANSSSLFQLLFQLPRLLSLSFRLSRCN